MARGRKVAPPIKPQETIYRFEYANELLLPTGFVVEQGELFKVSGKNSYGVGEWGLRFKFYRLVTNLDTGKQWVDCYEMFRGRPGVLRSFPIERVKRIPKKRRRKNVV